MDDLIFTIPSKNVEEEIYAFCDSFLAVGERTINGSERLDIIPNFDEWLAIVTEDANPDPSARNWVYTDTLLTRRRSDFKIIGILSLRYELNDFLKDFGHCGFSVLPAERGKGYATTMLEEAMHRAKEHGLSSLQLSAESTNVASLAVIRKCGGIFIRSFLFNDNFHWQSVSCHYSVPSS